QSDIDAHPTDYAKALGKVKTVTDAQSKSTNYKYHDLNGNGIPHTEEVIDPLNNKTVTTLNDLGYAMNVAVYPNGATSPLTTTDYTYDDNGNRQTETTTRALPGTPAHTETVKRTFVYDAAGQLRTNKVERSIDGGNFRPVPDSAPI